MNDYGCPWPVVLLIIMGSMALGAKLWDNSIEDAYPDGAIKLEKAYLCGS